MSTDALEGVIKTLNVLNEKSLPGSVDFGNLTISTDGQTVEYLYDGDKVSSSRRLKPDIVEELLEASEIVRDNSSVGVNGWKPSENSGNARRIWNTPEGNSLVLRQTVEKWVLRKPIEKDSKEEFNSLKAGLVKAYRYQLDNKGNWTDYEIAKNDALREAFQRIPGVGPAKSQDFVENDYKNYEDLIRSYRRSNRKTVSKVSRQYKEDAMEYIESRMEEDATPLEDGGLNFDRYGKFLTTEEL